MTFEVSPDDEHPGIRADGMHYDGLRLRAECKLAGKRFGVDVAFGDPISGEPELIVVRDGLEFASIARPALRSSPKGGRTRRTWRRRQLRCCTDPCRSPLHSPRRRSPWPGTGR